MQRSGSRILLSATDLVTFHECEHASALDRAALDDAELRSSSRIRGCSIRAAGVRSRSRC
jgi:hypothetical protein